MRFNHLIRAGQRAVSDGHRIGTGVLTPVRRTRVMQLRCPRCHTWVGARRWNPVYDVCTTCLPAAKAAHRAEIRAQQRHEDEADAYLRSYLAQYDLYSPRQELVDV